MTDDRSVFERLDNIEATGEVNKQMLAELLDIVKSEEPIPTVQSQPRKPSNQELFQRFLKQAKKSWRWFGTETKFKKQRKLTIISLVIVLAMGLISTIVSSICFHIYSTFTLFENIWLIFGVIYLVHAFQTQLTYEVNDLANNSSIKYDTDQLGMKFPRKEKLPFRIFKWLAIVAVLLNILCVWIVPDTIIKPLATIMEVLFLAAMIFALFMNHSLYSQYSIIWVEGHNLTTKEKVVLALPPGAKGLMTEEELKKKLSFLFE